MDKKIPKEQWNPGKESNGGLLCCGACGSTDKPEFRKEYLGHLLCPSCKREWLVYHPDWTWEEFLSGGKLKVIDTAVRDWNQMREKMRKRREQAEQLNRQGIPESRIAVLLGVSFPTVENDLREAKKV